MNEKEVEKARKSGTASSRPPYWAIFKKAFPQLFNVFFIFFITLTLFPTIQAGLIQYLFLFLNFDFHVCIFHSLPLLPISAIKRSDPNFVIPENLYAEVVCFLTFNVCAMLGSLTTSWIQWVNK